MFDIIIPTYKIRPDLIKRCLDSIDDQVRVTKKKETNEWKKTKDVQN